MKTLKTDVRVALISSDNKLIKALARKLLETPDEVERWIDFEFISDRESAADLAKYEVIIYDLDIVEGDLQHATIDLLEYKTSNPSTPLILIGGRKHVASAKASERIAPLIARSLSKPVLSGQLLIAVGIISPKLDENIIAPNGVSKRSKFLLSGAIFGLLAIAVSLLFFPKTSERSPEVASSVQVTQTQAAIDNALATDQLQSVPEHEVGRIYQMAQNAVNQGKLISPEGNNALLFLNQVLEIDPYHDEAYKSKQRLLNDIRVSFPQSISLGELEQSERIVAALTQYDPFNKKNTELQLELKRAVEQQAYRQRELEIAKQANQVEQGVEPEQVATKTDSSAVAVQQTSQSLEQSAEQRAQKEKQQLDQIYAAINTGNLIPPSNNNAYTQLLNALRTKAVNEAGLVSAKSALASALINSAKQSVSNSDLSKANKAIAFVRNLDDSHTELPALREQLLSKRNSIRIEKERLAKRAQNQLLQTKALQESLAVSSIEPFKVLKRIEPTYPKRAYNLDIEGWVEVEYQVNEEGKAVNVRVTQAEPKRVFDKSAIKAIKAWSFSPSVDSATGQAVLSEPSSSKFSFSLGS